MAGYCPERTPKPRSIEPIFLGLLHDEQNRAKQLVVVLRKHVTVNIWSRTSVESIPSEGMLAYIRPASLNGIEDNLLILAVNPGPCAGVISYSTSCKLRSTLTFFCLFSRCSWRDNIPNYLSFYSILKSIEPVAH